MSTKEYKRTLITAALPYANGGVHIGHLAGVYIPADIYARYLRLRGERVMFVCGSDEHGVPITIRARKEGITPQDVVNRYHEMIKNSFEDFGISFDVYSRTTSKTHETFAADFFRKLYDEGKLTEETTTQLYDEEAHQFLADRYVTGECPHCHQPGAYGDQCEKCGRDLSPTELINPKSAISGSVPVLRETKNWYLPLNEYQQWLREWILKGHKEWRPNVYGQCKSWLEMDLQPRAMTRDLDWGIPVPVEGAGGKVLYVWFDAPIGYVSNTKELCETDPARWGTWQEWWQQQDTKLVHFIGKDNIVFHCIIFPTMMKAHGGYILPDNVPSNEFLNLENDKISTSRNWAVWLHEYLLDFPGKQDVMRYVLTANAPETKDNNFTWADFQERNNSELVAIYGNFVNRALQLTKKYFGGVVPPCGELADTDCAAIAEFKDVKARVDQLLEQYKFREAQKEVMNLARIGNKYITECEPWKLWKQVDAALQKPVVARRGDGTLTSADLKRQTEANACLVEASEAAARIATVLYVSLQLVGNLSIAFDPFMPFSSNRLRKMLCLDSFSWDQLGRTDILPAGHAMQEPGLLFEKIEDEAVQAQLDRLERIKRENEAAVHKADPVKPDVSFEDWERLDIRIGTVLECEKVPKADKLLRFLIDDGLEKRTIVSGIAKFYKPEELVGKQVCFLANLPARKLRGIESQGMILSSEDADGSLSLVAPQRGVADGSPVK
ncbi:MAG: methionine--tRNA ligase [Alloprevotella sp.]|nr:methionine--tRNA ligase [Alloprevotella sp.]